MKNGGGIGFCLAEAQSNSITASCSAKGPPSTVVNITDWSSLLNLKFFAVTTARS